MNALKVSKPSRVCTPMSVVISLAALSSPVFAESPAVAPSPPARTAIQPIEPEAGPAGTKPVERQREGTKLVEQSGTFEFLGDRAAFVPTGGKESYRVLENLALERISRQQGDVRSSQEWLISGVLTEYRGANYLLMTKAVARAAGRK
jgi:hypothetical protein